MLLFSELVYLFITVLENIKVDTLYTHLKLSVFEMWNIISHFFQAIFFGCKEHSIFVFCQCYY